LLAFCTLIKYYEKKSYLQHDHEEMYRDESHQKDVGPLHVSGDSRWLCQPSKSIFEWLFTRCDGLSECATELILAWVL